MIVVVQLLLLRSSCGGFPFVGATGKPQNAPLNVYQGKISKRISKMRARSSGILRESGLIFGNFQLQVFEASSFQLQVFVQIQIYNLKFPTSSFQVSNFKFLTSKISTISSSSLQLEVCKFSTSSFQLQVFETSSFHSISIPPPPPPPFFPATL